MAKVTFDQAEKISSRGGNYFRLEDGQSATVRFLCDNVQQISDYLYAVHEYYNKETNSYAIINCAREENDPIDVCQWCVKMGNPVVRVFIPFYNEDTGKIEFWRKSYSYFKNTFVPFIQELQEENASLSGRQIKIKRTGKTQNDTQYTFIPIGVNDGKNCKSFGDVPNLFECGMLKEPDWEDTKTNQTNQNNNTYSQNNFGSTRSTTAVFN